MLDIGPFLNQVVYWSTPASLVAGGGMTWTAPAALTARVEDKPELVRTAQGGEAMSSSQVFHLVAAVKTGDRLWLPGANQAVLAESRTVMAVGADPDLDGNVPFRVAYL